MRRSIAGIALVVAAAGGVPLGAQQNEQAVPPATSATPSPQRTQLEQQLRRRIAQVVRTRLELTDDQFRQLAAVNQKYDGARRDALQEERAVRLELRAELMRGDRADQDRVGALLDRLLAQEQRRLDIVRAEQRDLAKFLTPVQRAKYVALQEQLRRRINELRQRQNRSQQDDLQDDEGGVPQRPFLRRRARPLGPP